MSRDARGSRAWRRLRDQVVRDEPACTLRYPGVCTGRSQTGDHIVPVAERPDLVLVRSNVRGSCHACNAERERRRRTPPRAPEPTRFEL